LSGALGGAFALTKVGANTATLSVANTFSGGLTVSNGTVALGHATAFGTGRVTVNNGTILGATALVLGSGVNNQTGLVTGASAVWNNGGLALTVGFGTGKTNVLQVENGGRLTNTATLTIGSATAANNQFILDGATSTATVQRIIVHNNNTLTFNGGVLNVVSGLFSNNHSGGAQLIGNGTQAALLNLQTGTATNYFAGGLTIQSNATVRGTSIIKVGSGTRLIVAGGGVLSPGASPGVMTAVGDVQWDANGHYLWETKDLAGAAGTDFDQWMISGTLYLNATAGNPFLIDLTTLLASDGVTAGAANNFPTSGREWLAVNAGSISGDTAGIAVNTNGILNTYTTGYFTTRVDVASGDIYVRFALFEQAFVWKNVTGIWSTNLVSVSDWVGGVNPATNGGEAVRLVFGGSNLTPYSSTNDLAGTFTLGSILLTNGVASVTNTITGNALAFAGDAQWVQNSNGSFRIENNISNTVPVLFTGSGSGAVILTGVLSGSGLTKTGEYTLVLAGANTFAGNVTINGGTISIGASNNLGAAANLVTINAGGALTSTGAWTDARSMQLAGGTLSGATFTNAGTLSGYGALTAAVVNQNLVQATNGTLAVTAPLLNNLGATVDVRSASTLTFSGSGSLTNAGRVQVVGGTLSAAGDLVNQNLIEITNSGAAFLTSGLLINSLGATVNVRSASTLTFSGSSSLTNAGRLGLFGGTLDGNALTNAGTIAGFGTLAAALLNQGTVEATNGTFATTSLLVNTGTVNVRSGGTLTSTGSGALTNAGQVQMLGGTLAGNAVTNTGTISGAGTLAAETVNQNWLVATNGTLSVTGAIAGTGTNQVVTSGTLALYGANTFVSPLQISGGTLLVTNDGALGNAANAVEFQNGGTLLITNAAAFVSARVISLNSSGTVSIASNSIAAWNGTIAGGGNLTKSGSGYLLLTNQAANYGWTGTTLVSGGTLLVNATLTNGGPVTVRGGTLLGTGTVATVIVTNSGTVSPGTLGGTLADQIGTFHGSNMTWGSGGRYLWQGYEMATGGTAGVNWDLIQLSGELTVSASAATPFQLTMQSLTNDGALGGPNNWPTDTSTYQWLVLTAAGGITGLVPKSNVTVDSSQWAPVSGTLYLQAQNTTNLFLVYEQIPSFVWGGTTNRWDNSGSWVNNNPPPTNGGSYLLYFTSATAYVATNDLVDGSGGYAFQLGTLVVSNGTTGVTAGNKIVGSNLNFIVSGGGIDKLGAGNFQIDNNIVLSNNIVIGTSAGGTGTLTLMGAVSGNQAITKAGNYNLVLGGSNAAYAGTMFLNAGTLTFSNAMSYTLSGVSLLGTTDVYKVNNLGTLTLANSTINLGYSAGLTGTVYVTGGGTLYVTNASVTAKIDVGGTPASNSNTLWLAGASTVWNAGGAPFTLGADNRTGNVFRIADGAVVTNLVSISALRGFGNVLSVTNGGQLFSAALNIGETAGSTSNRLEIIGGPGGVSRVAARDFSIGVNASTGNVVWVDGGGTPGGAVLTTGADNRFTSAGSGAGNMLVITNGGQVTFAGGFRFGVNTASVVSNEVRVVGAGSSLNLSGNNFVVGNALTTSGTALGNRVWIENGGVFTNGVLLVGTDGGAPRDNAVIITNGGKAFVTAVKIGVGSSSAGVGASSNYVLVSGATSLLQGQGSTPALAIGNYASATGNWMRVEDSAVATNFTTVTVGAAGTWGNYLVVTNGGKLFSTAASTVGSSSSNNWVFIGGTNAVTGANALWDLGVSTLTIGSGAATGNWVQVGGGGVLRNGTVQFNVDGGNTTNFGNYIQLDSNSTTAASFAFGNLAGASFVTNRVESGLESFTRSNLVRLGTGLTTWDGGGANLFVGTGTGANSNLVYLGNVTLTNWGVWTVGAAASTGNTLQAGAGFTGTVASVLVTGVNNRLQFDAGELTVTSTLTNNNGLAFQVGDGVQAAALNLTSASARNYFAGGLVLTNNALLRASGTITGGLTVRSNATFSSGNRPELLTADNVTWDGGGKYLFEVADFNSTAGVGWDLLVVTNALTLNASSGNPFIISLTSLTNDNTSAGWAANFDTGADYSLQIASYGSMSGFAGSSFTVDAGAFSNAPASFWRVNQIGNALYLSYSSYTNAADFVYTNGGAGNWSVGSHWTNGVAPPTGITGDQLQLMFAGGTAYVANNDNQVTNLNALLLNSGATGTNVLTGSGLVFTGANAVVWQYASTPFVISNEMALATDLTFRGLGGGAVTLASNLTGTGAITMRGGYNLTLSGSNTFTGPVVVNTTAGTLTLANARAIGANALTVSNGTVVGVGYAVGNGWNNQAILVTGSGSLWTNTTALTIGSGAATGNGLTVANGGRLAVNGGLLVGTNGAAGNSLVLSGAGTAVVTSASTVGYDAGNNSVLVTGSGSYWTNGGALTIGSGAATGNVVTVASSGRLSVNGAITVGTNGAIGNSLVITNGGKVSSTAASTIGLNATNNRVAVYGSSSLWNNGGSALTVGDSSATGNLLWVDGGVVTNVAKLGIGLASGSASWNQVVVTNGGWVYATSVSLGTTTGDSNKLTVAANGWLSAGGGSIQIGGGSGAALGNEVRVDNGTITNAYVVLGGGNAAVSGNQLVITNGGKLYTLGTASTIGSVGSNNTAIVWGNGSVWDAGGTAITNGGTGRLNTLLVAAGGLLTNVTTLWTGGGTGGTNTTTVSNGTVFAATAVVGRTGNASNELRITGTGLVNLSTGLVVTNGAGNRVSLWGGTLITASTVYSNGTDFVVGDGTQAASLLLSGTGNHIFEKNLVLTNNATLAGLGTITVNGGNGAFVIGSNATVSVAGSGSVGTLAVSGTNVWLGGGIYQWDWTDTNGVAGTAWDLVSVSGLLSNAATAGNRFVIDVGSVATNFDADLNYTRMIATSTVGVANYSLEAFTVVATSVVDRADGTWTVTTNGNSLVLGYSGSLETYTWTNSTGNWSNQAYWIEGGGIPPAAKSNLMVVFGGGTGNYVSTNDIAGMVLKRLWLTNNTGNLGTIIGSNITLVGVESIRQDGSGAMVVANGLTLGRNTTFGGTNTGTLTLDGPISSSGAYGFTKTGPWTLVLGGSNTFSGGVNLLGGVTVITNDAALGAANNLISLSNATLRATSSFTALRGFSVLGSNAVFDVQGASTYTVSGSLTGAGATSLIKSNTGTLAFAGTNGTMAGQTIVKEGTLRIGGGTWQDITNAATLLFDPASSATVNGNISGSGGITMQGGGTLVLAGNNTGLGGGLLIETGTVAANNDIALGATNAPVVISNGTLRAMSTYSSSRTLTTLVNATLSVGAGIANTWGGTISGAGNLIKSGDGELVLSAVNNYSGTTLVNGGTLRVNGALNGSGGLVTVLNGATLAGTGTIHRTVTLTNGVIVAGNNAPGTLTVSNLNWQSGGTYQLFTTNFNVATPNEAWSRLNVLSNLTFSGGGYVVDLISGADYFGADTNWVIATAGGISGFNASQFSIITTGLTGNVDGAFALGTNSSNGLLLTFSQGYTWTSMVNGVWGDTNNWQGRRAPPTNGDTTVLNFKGDGIAGNTNASFTVTKLIFNIGAGASQVLTGGTLVVDGTVSPTWEMRGTADAPVTISNNVELAKTLAMSGAGNGTLTIAGVISGTNFTKTGSWALNLSGANTFAGNVSITGGELGLGTSNSLGSVLNVVTLSSVTVTPNSVVNTLYNPLLISSNVTLNLTNISGTTFTLAGNLNGTGSLTKTGAVDLVIAGNGNFSGNTLLYGTGDLVFSNAGALSYLGAISGVANVIMTGSGSVTLQGPSSYLGDTGISNGTLIVKGAVLSGQDSALGNNTSAVRLSSTNSATLLGSGTLTFSRDIVVAGTEGTRTVGATTGGRVTYSGVISGDGGLTIGGGGIVELTSENTYAGTTTVSGATLIVNRLDGLATSAGLVTVTNAGTLGGTGLVVNSTIQRGGTLAPGEYLQVGSLSLSNSAWQGGGKYHWDITTVNNTTNNYAGNWDFIGITNLDLTALSSSSRFVIDLGDHSWTNVVIGANLGLEPSTTNSFLIASADNATFTNLDWFTVANNVVVASNGWWLSAANNGRDLLINYGYNENLMTSLVIPEPNVLLLWLSSIATIYAARRRIRAVKQRA
jgi:autotransporter-associated beta strand protein